jgi:hypothetical protein
MQTLDTNVGTGELGLGGLSDSIETPLAGMDANGVSAGCEQRAGESRCRSIRSSVSEDYKCWALGVGGQAGVTRVLQILREELETSMANLGVARVADFRSDHVGWSISVSN